MQRQYGQADDQHEGIEIQGLAAPVEVRRHPAARRLTLRVSPVRRTVILTMPDACDLDEAGTFVEKNLDWLHERLASLPQVMPFIDGGAVPVRGRMHRLCFVGAKRGSQIVWVEQLDGRGRRANGGARARRANERSCRLCVSGRVEHAPRRLRDWLVSEARADLQDRVSWHSRNLQLKPRRIAVRDQTTRWGSCSSSGVLSFSWRLSLAPTLVLDYVAAHEVAHLQEMNHGPRFWDLVRMTMPRMEEAQRWLKRHGGDLHSYGAEEA